MDTADTYRTWLVGLGLDDVDVEVARHAVTLTERMLGWWSSDRVPGMLQGMTSEQVDQVQQGYPDELERRAATELDATSLVGLGTRPGGPRPA